MKISPLRQRMLDALQLRGYSVSTVKAYVYSVESLSQHYRRSPENITPEAVQQWLLFLLKERHVSASTCRLYFNGVRFLYAFVLENVAFSEYVFTLPKCQQRLPDLLSRGEVHRLIQVSKTPVHRLLLLSCYACGLRVSELVRIRIADIDGERHLLHVIQGKGHKDRYVPIPNSLLQEWRKHWLYTRPEHWLFPSHRDQHLSITTLQKLYRCNKRALGIQKHGGIHSLRHAFATHSLAAGMPVHQLQRILGHQNLSTTTRYTHWIPESGEGGKAVDLISDLGDDSLCYG